MEVPQQPKPKPKSKSKHNIILTLKKNKNQITFVHNRQHIHVLNSSSPVTGHPLRLNADVTATATAWKRSCQIPIRLDVDAKSPLPGRGASIFFR